MTSSRAALGLLAVTAVGSAFGACAQGNQLQAVGGGSVVTGVTSTSSSGSGSSMGTGGSSSSGGIGSPCPDGRCTAGTCTVVGQTKYCTVACPPTCPTGTYCSIINGNPICIPDLGQECDKCSEASDCKEPSDACLTAPAGDSFCARDCSVDGLCPSGFTCESMSAYQVVDGGVNDAGSGGAGGGGTSSSATTSGGGTAGSSVGGAGGASGSTSSGTPGFPDKWCVPVGGASCACNSQRKGITNTCYVTNEYGTCTGSETCNGTKFEGCSAMTPAMEICNGKDDNCNGQIDEGNPNTLCAFMGAPPPNSTWACVNGACVAGGCDPGFTTFPPGSTACSCAVDSNGPNGSCAVATNMGSVSNAAGSPAIVIDGTLSSAGDVEVFTFTAKDTTLTGSNTFHVAINFTMPAANNEFLMDVEQGKACSDTPSGASTAITSYDWCVDGQSATMVDGGPVGEAPCGASVINHCTDHSGTYFVRVYRSPSASPTCTQFQVTISADAGACSTFTQCQ